MRGDSAHEEFCNTARLAAVAAIVCTMCACSIMRDRPGQTSDAIGTTRSRQQAPPPPTSPGTPTASVTPSAPPVPTAATAPAATTARAKTSAASPAGALSLRSNCTARDETGYTESIRLAVDEGRVGLLEAKIEIPRRGSCGFRLADFRQTRTEPHVELISSNGSMCTVRMWQQGGRFTVSFSDCQEKCTRGAFDYVWPVELNSADGSCL